MNIQIGDSISLTHRGIRVLTSSLRKYATEHNIFPVLYIHKYDDRSILFIDVNGHEQIIPNTPQHIISFQDQEKLE